ncbi:MAG TPA: DUF4153 domain-containing protein [Longimicrobiales bacterium]|nr:DUF4153 domain-containing protein [Longimicrobiales bacterium]
MGSTLTGRGRRYVTDAAQAWERAPVEVSTALLLAAAWSHAVQSGGAMMRDWMELAVAGLLVLAAAWTGTLLAAMGGVTQRTRWIITLTGAVLAALYWFLVLDLRLATEAWRAAMLVAAALLWVAAMPWLPRRSIEEMRAVTGRFVLRVLGAGLYCAALFAGLALAVGAVNTLFELNLDGKIFAHVFGWIALALGPWIVFGGVREYATPEDSAVAPVVHRMAAFLVPPLVAIYFLILYAYMVRMGVTGEVPKNLVSPMVFAAGVLVGLALLLFDPRDKGTLADWLLRVAVPLFLPLSVLGAWTIVMRVGQYGWTEFRLLRLLLVLAFGVLAVAGTVQLMRRRRLSLHVVLLGLAGLLLLSAVGPWSVHAVSRRSQEARLATSLRAAGIEPADMPAPEAPGPDGDRVIDAEVYDEILNTGHYLSSHHGAAALPPVLRHAPAPHGVAVRREEGDVHGALRGLGLRPAPRDTGEPEMRYGRMAHTGAVDVAGVRVRRVYAAPYRGESSSGDITAVQDGSTLRMRVDGTNLTARLDELAALLRGGRDPRAGELSPAEARLTVQAEDGSEAGALLVLEVNIETTAAGLRLHRLDGILLLPR